MLKGRKQIAKYVVYNYMDINFEAQENLGMYFYKV